MPRTFRPKRQRQRPPPAPQERRARVERQRGRYASVQASELGDGFSPSHDWRPHHVFERIAPARVHDLESGS